MMSKWTFITNHGAVLSCIAANPEITGNGIATRLRITERTVRRIIADLEAGGYIEKDRIGRANRYRVNLLTPLRRPESQDVEVGKLLRVLLRHRGWGSS